MSENDKWCATLLNIHVHITTTISKVKVPNI